MRFKQNITGLIVVLFIITGCVNNKSALNTEITTNVETETTTQQIISTEQNTITQTESTENSSTSKDDNIYYDLDIDEIERLANQGDAKAQFSLGRLYSRGEKVTQNYQKAFEWYTKAAEQGYIYAQYNLGVMYYKGMNCLMLFQIWL